MRSKVRRIVDVFKGTPLHPQWLMRGREFETAQLRDLPGGRVLDIGCATCWAKECLPPDCTYIGLDYPATGAGMYQARPDVFADASVLPFASGSIDTVLLFETLEHIDRPNEAIDEVSRVLVPGGRLVLTVPFLYPLHDEPYDFTRFTMHGLRYQLERAGLSTEYLEPSLGSAESAGLIVCLSLGGMTLQAVKNRSVSMVLSPLTVLAIPIANLLFWSLGRILPSWRALPAGYHVVARKSG